MTIPTFQAKTTNKTRRIRIENLEQRQMLAADGVVTIETDDAARMDEIAGVIAADINSDGRITAVDALQVINHINAVQGREAGSDTVRDDVNRVVDTVFSRIANLDTDGNGRVTEVDALRVINRINDGVDSVVDAVMSRLPQLNRNGQTGPIVGGEVRNMVGELLKGLNSVRSRADLSPGRIARLVNEVAAVAGEAQRPSATSIGSLVRTWQSSLSDRELSTSELAAIRSDLTSVLSSAGVNTGRVNAVWDDVESAIPNWM